jgi:signal transduction histidine kinase
VAWCASPAASWRRGPPNGAGAALAFEILPAYYQTGWFRLLAAAAALGLVFAIYRWRVGQVTAKLAWQFEERLAERTRIANELHDTLLQGFISAAMQLSVAFARLPPDLPEKERLDRVLGLMRRVIDEGRDAVRGLRAEAREEDDLARAFARVPGELGLDREIAVRTLQDERPRRLHPIVRDEAYRIGREALVNALRHSRAENVGIDIEYRAKSFGLIVADDGIGIDPAILVSGRPGHWGIAGMRERALRLAARLTVTSAAGQGTRIELAIPATAAYANRGWRRGVADTLPL